MSDGKSKCLLVLTSLPNREGALKLAQALVGKRLAACVNVLDQYTSVYRWKDAIEIEPEILLLIKTHAERFDLLQQEILACHPYELPEIVAVPVEVGLAAYLDWVSAEVNVFD